ncbi:MAG: MYXO-CTERM sorting domain-containing protein [Myxococcota bacterium]
MKWLLLATIVLLSSYHASPARADFIDHFANISDVGQMKVPRRGSAPVLVIPVIIDDQPFESPFQGEQDFLAELHRAFDPSGVGGNTFAGYYGLTSFGRYHPEPTVAAPVHFATCPTLGGHTGCLIPRDGGLSSGDVVGAVDLLRDTVRFIDEILGCATAGPGGSRRCTSGGGVSLSSFDRSGPSGSPDQFADGVVLVSNGPFPGITLPVKWLANNAILRLTVPPMPSMSYGGVTVGAVAIAGRANQRSSARIAVHEFGHLLGFADLYNERGTSTDLPYSVMGGWQYASAPPLLDPFSRGMIGWGNIQEVSGHQVLTIRPARDGGPILKLGTGSEYFLAEYRTGGPDLDQDLSIAGGVVLERVRLSKLPAPDPGRFLRTLANCVNCAPWDPLVMIEEADGRYDLEAGDPVDDAADLFVVPRSIGPSTDTSPRGANHLVSSTNLLSGPATGVSLRVLELHPTHAIVEVEAPVLADPCADLNLHLCRELSCSGGYCGDRIPPPPPDAGFPDLGQPLDAGEIDAGADDALVPGPDAMAEVDAGAEDAGQPLDLGAADAGLDAQAAADAGAPDLGSSTPSDAEALPDLGAEPPPPSASGGCACQTSSGAGSWEGWVGAFGLWWLRRRRRACGL